MSYETNYKKIAKTGEPIFHFVSISETSRQFPMVILDTTLQEKAKATLVTIAVSTVLQGDLVRARHLALLILAFDNEVKNLHIKRQEVSDIKGKYDFFKAIDLKPS